MNDRLVTNEFSIHHPSSFLLLELYDILHTVLHLPEKREALEHLESSKDAVPGIFCFDRDNKKINNKNHSKEQNTKEFLDIDYKLIIRYCGK